LQNYSFPGDVGHGEHGIKYVTENRGHNIEINKGICVSYTKTKKKIKEIKEQHKETTTTAAGYLLSLSSRWEKSTFFSMALASAAMVL
jgi:hypothetical protein